MKIHLESHRDELAEHLRMIEHAGLGSVFSVLIVVAFTLVLREVERSPPSPLPMTPGQPALAQSDAPIPPASRPARRIGTKAAPSPTSQATAVVSSAAMGPLAGSIEAPRPLPAPSASTVSTVLTRRGGGPPVGPSPAVPAANQPGLAPGAVPPQPLPGRQPESKPKPNRPRSSVTTVEPGEQLHDIAARVYGSAEATTKIWRANRDRLPTIDSPVSTGWLLRTP